MADIFEFQLISEIERRELLYNQSHANYRNKRLKAKAWREIANKTGRPTEQCITRWKSLRDRFARDLRTINTSDWKYFNVLSFLKPHIIRDPKPKFENEAEFANLMISIIEEVQRYKFIYDTNHCDYDNDKLKDEAWLRIARAVGKPAEECRKHWKSLCNNFTEAYVSDNKEKWKPYYEQMLFMADCLDLQNESTVEQPTASVDSNQPLIDDFNESLLKEVEKYHFLYDQKHPEYGNKLLRDQTWIKIAKDLSVPADRCRVRWRSLRSHYVRVLNAQEDSEDSIWKYTKLMSFLDKYVVAAEASKINEHRGNNYINGCYERQLLSAIIKYPCIYDRGDVNFRNREIKDNIWLNIAIDTKSSEERCRTRWKSLRERFVREYLTVVSVGGESSWRFYNDMCFLLNHLDDERIAPTKQRIDTFEENLIKEIRKFEFMYNREHIDSRNRELRQKTWIHIASVVGTSPLQCMRRWKSLRDLALKEHCKMLQDKNYVSNWKHYNAMAFIKLYINPKNPIEQEPSPDDSQLDCSKYTDSNSANDYYLSPKRDSSIIPTTSTTKRDIFCRTCMEQIQSDNATIFERPKSRNIFETPDLLEMLRMCIHQNIIQTTDEYPHSVCEKCYNKILDFCQFKLMCKNSLEKFNELLKKDKQSNPVNESPMHNNSLKYEYTSQKCTEQLNNVKPMTSDIIDLEDSMDSQSAYFSHFASAVYDDKEEAKWFEGAEEEKRPTVKVELEEYKTTDPLAFDTSLNSQNVDLKDGENGNEESADKDNSNLDATSKKSLPADAAISQRKPPYKCDFCPKTFTLNFRLQAHRRQHKLSKNLSENRCPYEKCQRLFTTAVMLEKHLDDHKNSHSFKCNIGDCEKVYNSHYNLNKHKMTVHKCEKENPVYTCEKCGKTFKHAILLKTHRHIHKDASLWPYVCDEEGCSAKFQRLSLYRIHKRRHTGVKNHMCPYCGHRTYTSGEMNRHINIHTFARKYPCPYCPLVCKSSAYRGNHIRKIHRQPQLYSCSVCDATFTTAFNRKHHELSHKGEIPYSCDQCDKKFKWKAALKKHKNQVHMGGMPFECDICGKRFVWKGSLTKHKQLYHKEDIEHPLEEGPGPAASRKEAANENINNKDSSTVVETNDDDVIYTEEDGEMLMIEMVDDVENLIEEDYMEYLIEEIE
ncbi:uncharacterized protein [Musca autumnalis]|uniref:uncharacterized protein n=1 Tax=Musca autumnalis TaxID=221902 RepID=UPI003CE96B94